MNVLEAFGLLFTDTWMGYVLITFHAPYVREVLRVFPLDSAGWMMCLSWLGMVLALPCNFFLGRAFRTIPKGEVAVVLPLWAKRALWVSGIGVAWIPLIGPAVQLCFGFARQRLLWVWLASAVVQAVYATMFFTVF